MFGVEVYSDGKLIHQYADTTEHRYPIYSATKTITSIAVGMAVDEGKLSKEYVKEATAVQQMNREGGYGYYVWKYRNGFSINGKWKQKCYVLPKEKLMVTYLSHIEEETAELKESMERKMDIPGN